MNNIELNVIEEQGPLVLLLLLRLILSLRVTGGH